MHNLLVMHSDELDLVFSALADPTRRDMLEQMAGGEQCITDLGRRHSMSQPAISKHVKVLERAGLVTRTRDGRHHRLLVNPRPIEEARTWIDHYAQFWKDQFDAVDVYLKKYADADQHTRS